jgi:hypothetical protein
VRKFKVIFSVEVELEVADEVIKDALSEEFRTSYYKLDDAAGVAQHLAYNFVANRAGLSSLDGFAHWTNEEGKRVGEHWDFVECTEEAAT